MTLLGPAKQRLGARLISEAPVEKDHRTPMCATQAGAVLIGLPATATVGWSWLDPTIGLLLAAGAINEGIEGLARR